MALVAESMLKWTQSLRCFAQSKVNSWSPFFSFLFIFITDVKSPDYGSDNPDNLCALCPDECTKAGNYSGYAGAFQCLKDGLGDVAFVKHTTVPSAEASNYQYLCKDGSRAGMYCTNCQLFTCKSA